MNGYVKMDLTMISVSTVWADKKKGVYKHCIGYGSLLFPSSEGNTVLEIWFWLQPGMKYNWLDFRNNLLEMGLDG